MNHDDHRLPRLPRTPFKEAFEQMSDALAITTVAESPIAECILYVNPAFVRLSGYTADQLLGHSTLLLAGARPDWQHVRELGRAAKEQTFFTVTRKYRPDGAAYDVALWRSPLRNRSGKVTHFLLRQCEVTHSADFTGGEEVRDTVPVPAGWDEESPTIVELRAHAAVA